MVEITDKYSAQAWLETQPQQVCVAMAARAALRGLAGLGTTDAETIAEIALPVLRALLTAGSASTCPANAVNELKNAANFASRSAARSADYAAAAAAAYSTDSLADSVAISAAYSVGTAHFNSATDSASSAADAIAYSASLSVQSADYLALEKDLDGINAWDSIDMLFHYHLWQRVEEPGSRAEGRAALLRFLDADPAKWDFWARWYRGMFDGRPMDWALQREVALIPEDVWKAGPEAVAARIAEIERDFKGEPLDQDALRSHVRRIAATPDFHADAAESVATTLDTAIRAYCQQAYANDLPDGFAQFEWLKSGFRAISVTLRQRVPVEDKTAELQAQINELHGIVGKLQRELADARAQLMDARLSALEAERQRRSGSALLTTLASFATIGAFGLGAMTFFGVKAGDFGYDTVRRDAVALAKDYAAPDRSARTVPRPTAAPANSPRPEPRRPE
jgi:hypothetical protein